MINYVNNYLVIIILSLFLSSCTTSFIKQLCISSNIMELEKKQSQLIQHIPSASSLQITSQQSTDIEYQNNIVQTTQQAHNYDWSHTIQIMIGKMLQTQNINSGSILLVDNTTNCTNGSINTIEATEIMRNILAKSDKFILISTEQLSIVKQQLGLSSQDNFGTRSKTIGIAHNVKAQYVLYSSATGDVNSPELHIQLILVNTGEIIWSDKDIIKN